MCEYLKALQKPFPAEDIEWRVSHATKGAQGAKALVLAYVTNRAIMERLDDVFGISGWKNEYREWRQKGVLCAISCKVENEWIEKSDGADETNMEATKGGFSASMKRAAVQWGIGRYLYNLEQTWVPVRASGKNYINSQIKNSKEYITGYWETPKLPDWALPENYEHKDTPLTQAHEPVADESIVNLTDEDLNAFSKATEEFTGNSEPYKKPSEPKKTTVPPPKVRVYKLREELKWGWPDLTTFASDVLKREVKYLNTGVKTDEEWTEIEKALLITKAAS